MRNITLLLICCLVGGSMQVPVNWAPYYDDDADMQLYPEVYESPVDDVYPTYYLDDDEQNDRDEIENSRSIEKDYESNEEISPKESDEDDSNEKVPISKESDDDDSNEKVPISNESDDDDSNEKVPISKESDEDDSNEKSNEESTVLSRKKRQASLFRHYNSNNTPRRPFKLYPSLTGGGSYKNRRNWGVGYNVGVGTVLGRSRNGRHSFGASISASAAKGRSYGYKWGSLRPSRSSVGLGASYVYRFG